MEQAHLHSLQRNAIVALWVASCMAATCATAADDESERAQLAALVRQVDLIDRLADQAGSASPQERMRYHFDYARLHDDLQRVRTGIQDYLVPERAQPRDPIPLSDSYTRDGAGDSQQATTP